MMEAQQQQQPLAARSSKSGMQQNGSLQPRDVPVNSFSDVRPVLRQALDQMDYPFVRLAEQKTGMDREKVGPE